MLECSKLKKEYFNKTAVQDISLRLEKGRVYALLGPNGSGKTTFMKMAAGLVKPTQGTILYEDKPIGAASKRDIAYMSTEPYFYSFMTVESVGKYYKDFFEDFDEKLYHELIGQMELQRTDKVTRLSSGMMAKLKVAVTIARKAKLYLLDEPLNGIDLIAREKIITAILRAAGEDCAIVISSHLVDELEPVVDSVIFIKDGVNILTGNAEAVREEQGKSIVDLYRELYV
ncbi:MAG: ABC transporter ATP-binding protein [Roseburia sp.]|nr:ABC transporter ATP-binding protein [Roseburia sp.]